MNPAVPVVLSGFSSDVLERVTGPDDPVKSYQNARLGAQLALAVYDAVDLHFYHCAADIAPKIAWLTVPDPPGLLPRLPADRIWISTENGGPDLGADPARCTVPAAYDGACGVFECTQAADVATRLTACRTGGGAVCMWFSLRDAQNEVPRYQHLGLVDQANQLDQTDDRHRKAFCAFRTLADPAAPPFAGCAPCAVCPG